MVAWILLQLAAGVVLGIAFVAVIVAAVAAVAAGGSGQGGLLLVVVLLFLGAIVLIVWLATKFAFTVPTIALEGRGVFSAAAQSWRLTRGAFWRTFGILLLVQVVFGFAASIASLPLTFGAVFASGTLDPLGQTGAASGIGPGAVVAVVVGALLTIAVQCLTDVLSASIVTFLAIDRRIRTRRSTSGSSRTWRPGSRRTPSRRRPSWTADRGPVPRHGAGSRTADRRGGGGPAAVSSGQVHQEQRRISSYGAQARGPAASASRVGAQHVGGRPVSTGHRVGGQGAHDGRCSGGRAAPEDPGTPRRYPPDGAA